MKKMKNRKASKSKTSTRNREFAVITYMFLAIFISMMGYFVYFQVIKSEDVINSPYNRRQDTFAQHVIRGEIKSDDGTVLAQSSVSLDGSETRTYPYGRMFAHAIGYDSNGKAGIESFANFNLLRSNAFFIEKIFNGFKDEKNPGDNVVTTLNYKLQETAYHALGERNGAIIVMEPSTGKILAMVSKPDYDPNTIIDDWEGIVSNTDSSNSVLVNRTTQGLYPPGSIFKMITLLEYTKENINYQDYTYECLGSIEIEDTLIRCYNNTVHGHEDLMKSFAKSCNASFANIGLSLDKKSFSALCNRLLFHTDLPTSYPFKQSQFTLNNQSNTSEAMQTAIGQGETLVTPMHMAMLTSAIANQGVAMKPYIMDHTENYKGITVKEYKPVAFQTILTEEETNILDEFMKNVVTEGTGSKLSGGNYTAAGKTGSAEYSNVKGESHAWFTGYASNDSHGQISVTVIVEGGGAGSDTAVPIARQLFDQYFR